MDIIQIKTTLKEGMEFKSWKALCEALDEPYSNQTHTKKSQERKFKQFFDFEKIEGTHGIRITKIFDDKQEDFASKGSRLPEVLDPAILSTLDEGKFITNSQIAKQIGLTSNEIINFYNDDECAKNIAMCMQNHDEDYDEYALNKEIESKRFKTITFFVSMIQSSYKASFKSALDRLQNKGLINYKKVLAIQIPKDYEDHIMNTIDNHGICGLKDIIFPWIYEEIVKLADLYEFDKTLFKKELKSIIQTYGMSNNLLREAYEDEIGLYKQAKHKLLTTMGYETEKTFLAATCYEKRERSNYYLRLNKSLSKYYVKFYTAYHIQKVYNEFKRVAEGNEVNEVFYNARIKSYEKFMELQNVKSF